MKKTTFRLLSLLLMLTLLLGLVSCDGFGKQPVSTTEGGGTVTEAPTSTQPPTGDVIDDGNLRVIITSDMHYSMLQQYSTYYGMSRNPRMQKWVNTIKAEHQKKPIDLVIIAGDVSFDHIYAEGSYTKYKVKDTKNFVDAYVSQIREMGIPVFVLGGNHDQFNNTQWKEMTGNDRQCSYAIKGHLFIMLDTFAANLEPNYVDEAKYSGVDEAYVKAEMAKYPDHKVWLVAHHFDTAAEGEEFQTLLKTEGRIKGLFQGHTHKNEIISLGAAYGGKKIAQTGNFSYTYYTAVPPSQGLPIDMKAVKNSFWGIRDLVITTALDEEMAVSNYIIAEVENVTVNKETFSLQRREVEKVRFY